MRITASGGKPKCGCAISRLFRQKGKRRCTKWLLYLRKCLFTSMTSARAELAAVAEVLKGPILTTGKTVSEFEEKFARLLRAKHAIGVTSCTGALHLSLLALGIGPGMK